MAKQKINGSQQSGIAFKASRSTALTTPASGQTSGLTFNNELYDYGSGYDNTTGLFTAPVSGVYSFKFVAYVEATANTRAFWIGRGTAFAANSTMTGARYADMTVTTMSRLPGVAEFYMTAGQTFGLELWTSAATNIASLDTWFAGHLVMAV